MLAFYTVKPSAVLADQDEEVIDLSTEEKGELYVYPNLDTTSDEEIFEIELGDDPVPEEILETVEEGDVILEDDILDEEALEEGEEVFLRMMPFSDVVERAISKPGILGFHGSESTNIDIYANSTGTAKLTYISSSAVSNGDAAVLEEANGRYKIKIAGVTGWVINDSSLVAYYPSDGVKSISHYKVDANNDLNHFISRGATQTGYSKILNGKAPSTLKQNTVYYSYDGNYFYLNRDVMLNDYKNDNTNNAVNKSQPFFNYFQYLSYRTKSNITGAQMDEYIRKQGYTSLIADKTGNTIKPHESNMVGAGMLSAKNGNDFGTNAAMTFTLGIHESGWGRSYIAASKNNLFGHSAYDSKPESANGYQSVNESIYVHNVRFLNWHYLDISEANYYGAFFGNKLSGINVKYASDAYWGEKAAQHYHNLDREYGNVDYNSARLGVKQSNQDVNIRKEPNTSSPVISNPNISSIKAVLEPANHSFVILGEYTGETISGSNIWYRISIDSMVLVPSRTLMPWYSDNRYREAQYKIGQSYGYVHSSLVTPLSYSNQPPVTPPDPGYKLGDVNGDGRISILDMMAIRMHLLGQTTLTETQKKAADVNKDGRISILDMMAIRLHLLGTNPIR